MSCLCRILRTATCEIVHWSGRQDCSEPGRETSNLREVNCSACDSEMVTAPTEAFEPVDLEEGPTEPFALVSQPEHPR